MGQNSVAVARRAGADGALYAGYEPAQLNRPGFGNIGFHGTRDDSFTSCS